jgi:hypothetical protein
MEKYDIIQCFRDSKSTSDRYVLVDLYSNGNPKAVVVESVFQEGDENKIKFRTLFMGINDDYPWKVIGKADTSSMGNPHSHVIRKIKLMNAKRKEQGYAF